MSEKEMEGREYDLNKMLLSIKVKDKDIYTKDEIIESESEKIIEQHKEKENEMQLKINDLMQNLQLIKFENQKEIIDLKNQLNEKKEEIINHENLKNKLKMQLEKETSKIDELNNQINDLKEKNRILSEENTKLMAL